MWREPAACPLSCVLITNARTCSGEWCSSGGMIPADAGVGQVGQAARIGRLTRGSSPMAATLSRVM